MLERTITIPPVVVTPTRTAQPVLEVSRSVERVGAKRVEEIQARTVPEALEEAEGVHIQNTNRGSGAPIIRGFVGPQNLILIDGIRFNTSTFRTGPNQYLALLDPNAILSLEVVRGASSVLYGNGAMGGVLHALTDEPLVAQGAFEHDARVMGRFGSGDLSGGGAAMFTGSIGNFGFLIGGTYDHFGTLRVGGGDEVPLSDYDAGYWRAKLRYDPGAWSISLGYLGMLMRNAGRTDTLGRGEVRQYDNDDHLTYARFEWSRGLVERLRATVSYHRLGEFVERYNCTTNADKTVADRSRCAVIDLGVVEKQRRNDDTVETVGSDLELILALWGDRIKLATGFDLYHDWVQSSRADAKKEGGFVFTDKPRGNFSDGSRYLTLGTYLHADVTVMDVTPQHLQLRLNGGIRYSHFDASASDVPELGDIAYRFDGVVGSAGVQLLIPEAFSVYGAFLQGFRAPNLQETTVLGNTGSKFEVPNADLEPERSDTYEVGAKVRYGQVDASVAYFYSQLRDAIDEEAAQYQGQAEVDGTPVIRRVNTAEGTSQGVEGRLGVTVWRLRLAATVAWMTSELTDGDGSTTPARRIPPLSGTATLRYTHPDRTAYGEFGVRWAGPQRDLHPSDVKDLRICETETHSGVLQTDCDGTDGFVVLNLRGGWQFHENVRADLSVANILDTNYRQHGSGYDGPGVDARLSLTATF